MSTWHCGHKNKIFKVSGVKNLQNVDNSLLRRWFKEIKVIKPFKVFKQTLIPLKHFKLFKLILSPFSTIDSDMFF